MHCPSPPERMAGALAAVGLLPTRSLSPPLNLVLHEKATPVTPPLPRSTVVHQLYSYCDRNNTLAIIWLTIIEPEQSLMTHP